MTERVKYYNTLKHRKAIGLYRDGMSKTDVAHTLGLQYRTIDSWLEGKEKHHEAHKVSRLKKRKPRKSKNKGMKLKYHNIKQKLLRDYASGKYNVSELARKYGIDSRTAMKWKIKRFGHGNMKKRRMFQMKQVGVPTLFIAEFYGVSVVAANKNIREFAKDMQNKLQTPSLEG